MRTLEQIERELSQTAEVADKNLEDIHPNVRAGWAVRIDGAKDKVRRLTDEYREAFMKNAVAIFLDGDAEKVGQTAAQIAANGGISVSAKALYERLADVVEPSMSDARTWGVQQVYLLHTALMGVMSDLGLNEMPMPDRSLEKVVRDRAEVVGHIRQVLREAVGDMLNRMYLEKLTVEQAIKIRFTGATSPVFIVGAATDEIGPLSAGFGKGFSSATILADDEVNEALISKILKDVNKKIRSKK